MTYAKEDVKESLTTDDIFNLLEFFNAEPKMASGDIVAKTICHNGDTHKLYYYEENQLFHCYSDSCGTFDVIELVQKVEHIDDFNQAINFLVRFFNLESVLDNVDFIDKDLEDWKIFEKYSNDGEQSEELGSLLLDSHDDRILKYYPKPHIIPWEEDGISKEVCDYMGICYDPVQGAIIVPHRDEFGRLVGIRQRTLIQEEEKWGKYRPWYHNGKMYNHPLSFNLYGFDVARDNIENMRTAIVVESEKAVLQYMSMFGVSSCICVAICGSSLSKYQFDLLYNCGINELVIGFDKDFQEIGSDEYDRVIKKLYSVYHKYGSKVNVSFLFDSECNVLGYHSSPLDEGKDKFLYLFKNRIVL